MLVICVVMRGVMQRHKAPRISAQSFDWPSLDYELGVKFRALSLINRIPAREKSGNTRRCSPRTNCRSELISTKVPNAAAD